MSVPASCRPSVRPSVFYTLNTGINVFCMLTNVYQCMFNNLNDKEIKMNESLMKFIFNFLKQPTTTRTPSRQTLF